MTSNFSVKKQTLVGLSTALMIIFSQIAIPLPIGVPITLQTFVVIIIAIVLEAELATATMGIYTFLGCLGLPVFSNFSGGLQRVLGPSGGFIMSFMVMAFIIGRASQVGNKFVLWIGVYMGLAAQYMIGAMYLAFIGNMDFSRALTVFYPFLIKDIILAGVAVMIATRIKVRVNKCGIRYV
ncbi:MAG: biotin transporter BioY [Cellulosilyticum sp.]|nr:biotin transporter BioY [Cellulosilyticum sp.]